MLQTRCSPDWWNRFAQQLSYTDSLDTDWKLIDLSVDPSGDPNVAFHRVTFVFRPSKSCGLICSIAINSLQILFSTLQILYSTFWILCSTLRILSSALRILFSTLTICAVHYRSCLVCHVLAGDVIVLSCSSSVEAGFVADRCSVL